MLYQKKNYHYLTLVFLFISVTACTPSSEVVMKPLSYNNSVSVHSSQKADLYWISGNAASTVDRPSFDPTAPIASALVNNMAMNTYPQGFTFIYGKTQQAAFMNALKDDLLKNHVFAQVNLITDLKQAKSGNIFITVNFRETSVNDVGHALNGDHQIILNTDLSIKGGNKPPYFHTYYVQSKKSGFMTTSNTFQNEETDVSQQLLDKIMGGIATWSTQGK